MLSISRAFIEWMVHFSSGLIEPSMMVIFLLGVTMRGLVQFTVKREEWFAKEFEKRINTFMMNDDGRKYSFYSLTKRLIEKTFYEVFEIRGVMMRRKMDYIMAPSDRIFLIQSGAARIVRDTLKQIKFLRYNEQAPKFLEISKSVFQNNPCFNSVFGWFPLAPVTEFLNALPGLFVVGGIFGTFLGIMRALPEIGGMNLNDTEGSKLIMDAFLLKVSFSMSSSVTGIFLSVLMQVINIILSPELLFVDIVNRYELSLEYLWRRCDHNTLPETIPHFDEHRDPLEASAELSVARELEKVDKGSTDKRRSKPPGQAVPVAVQNQSTNAAPQSGNKETPERKVS
jgi:hypothetical protein